MRITASILFVLILTFTVQSHNVTTPLNHNYHIIASAYAKPDLDRKDRIKNELEEVRSNKKKLNEIEIQQKSIHKNLEELKMLVQDKCKKQKAN